MEIDNRISEVATAAALAFVDIETNCEVQGNAFAMIDSRILVSARAEAYATAVSDILVSGDVCPNCTIVADAVVRSSRSIIAEAVAEAEDAVCSNRPVLPVVLPVLPC